VNANGTDPPPWLIERVGEEIRRGMRLVRASGARPGLVVDSVRFALFLDGAWSIIGFDQNGQVQSGPPEE
jgi:hypothetical protein